MTNDEKIKQLEVLILPDTATNETLMDILLIAEGIVLNRRYPFGPPENAEVPVQYEHIQLQVALELYAKRGAEGQTAHNENGISRTYETADVSNSLLRKIVPLAGSVM